jgi:hypothetical protein
MPRIVVLDTLSPDGLKLLEEAKPKGIEYQVRTGLKGDALRETLAQFDFEIRYRTGKSNPADGPLRRPDYKPSDDERAIVGLPTLQGKLQLSKPEFAQVVEYD